MHFSRVVKRIIFWIIVAVIAIPVILGAVAKFKAIDKPPTVVDAPFIIQTSSRIYYAKQMRLDGPVPSIRGYWTLDGKHYKYHPETLSFPESIYGIVSIVRRVNVNSEIVR
jgi:hypothetical protein